MKTRRPLIASLVIAALAMPIATVGTLTLATTPAFAKGPKDGGGGKGSERSSNARQSGANKPTKGNSRGGGKGNGNGAVQQTAAISAASAQGQGAHDNGTGMHPSQLGSMNGALNANINAVLAHIRNGNTNGPVGALAALAVAEAGVDDAQAVLDRADAFAELDAALAETEYETLADYLIAVELGEIEPIDDVEAAILALGEDIGTDAPTEEEIAAAAAALEELMAAEDGIFAAWNKSGEATEEEKAALLEALRARLDAESDAINETIDSVSTDTLTEDEELEQLVENLEF
jgi:hypothetical protein